MAEIPRNLSALKIKEFADYLLSEGATVLAPTNPYEVIRYKTTETVKRGQVEVTKQTTHIVYRKENGRLTYTGWSNKHYKDYMRGWPLGAPAPSTRPKPKRIRTRIKAPLRRGLLERDGTECWFCGQEMPEDDTSIEHLLSQSLGGGNGLANLCLAHQGCNSMADNKSLVEKMALRDELRRLSESGDYEP